MAVNGPVEALRQVPSAELAGAAGRQTREASGPAPRKETGGWDWLSRVSSAALRYPYMAPRGGL